MRNADPVNARFCVRWSETSRFYDEGLETTVTPPRLIVRFALVAEQSNSRDEERLSSVSSENSIAGIKRYTGFVRGRDLFSLFDHVSLEAKLRAAKVGSVTTLFWNS